MRNIVFVSVFTAFLWVLGIFMIPIPGVPVPLVLQNMGVLLAGLILGPMGTLSVLLFLLLAAMGFPILAGGRGGIAIFFGPTLGYLIGYLFAAAIVGFLTKRFWLYFNYFFGLIFSIIGILVIYLIGIPVLMANQKLELMTAIKAQLVFIPFDIIKAAFAAFIAVLFKKYYPVLNIKHIDDTNN